MSQFWSRLVHDLTPYTPGEQPQVPNLIKLNTNENPYPPSPKVLSAIQQASDQRLKLYPDPNSQALKETIAHYHELKPENIFIGNGSDEVLAHTFQALLKQDKPLLFPDITYSFYPVYCGLYDVAYNTVPLNNDFTININDYKQDCGAIIFPNPNAPTGRILPLAQIEQLLQSQPNKVVVVDEAYIDFGGESALGLVPQYPNLLVTQTLSKSRSLAGLRVGFAVGHADLIIALERVKNSFNSYPVDCLAEQGAIASFQDEAYFQQTRQKVMQTRGRLSQFLQHKGFNVLPSAANFVFVSHPEYNAAEIALQLREQAIIVRYFNKPRINEYLRISIGSDAENKALCDALDQIIT